MESLSGPRLLLNDYTIAPLRLIVGVSLVV